MTKPKPVLDYAGPRPPAGLRLPARSVLSVDLNDDHVIVLETLRGKASAIFAPGMRSFLIEMLLIALVINDTWRKTVLTARKDGLAVEFFSPLTRRRRIERMPDEMVSVRAVNLSAERGAMPKRVTPTVFWVGAVIFSSSWAGRWG